MRPGQQTEQHEHHDLRQPGNGVEKNDNGIVGARLLVADHKSGEIDREKSRGVHRVGEGEDNQRADRHERRMQALRQRQSVEHQSNDLAAGETDNAAEDGIAQESHHSMRPALIADQQDLYQQQGKKHRERIIGAGFHFQHGAHARTQPQAPRIDEEKDRGRIS